MQYAQIIFSFNTLFAIFGAQQGLELGGLGIRDCQCVQSFSCLAKPPHIPAIKSHLSAEDPRAWHSCFSSPAAQLWLLATSLSYTKAQENAFE